MWIENDGLLIGRIQAKTGPENPTTITFNNDGAWFVTGRNYFYGGPEDTLNNWGLVQTAFDSREKEHTSFKGLNDLDNYGMLSMIDGGAGDRTYISGEYYGGGTPLIDSQGYLGVDVKFGQPWDNSKNYKEQMDQLGKSDKLTIGGYAEGQTEVVVNGVNDHSWRLQPGRHQVV